MSIKAILYSKFDPVEGPKIVHQVPENSVSTGSDSSASTNNTTALLSFSTISRFLIPRQSLCGNLISLTPPPLTPSTPPTIILSYPVCITSSHYPRNEFIFNFALVLSPPDTIDIPSYKSVVTKLAQLMRSLEEQSYFLSADDTANVDGTGGKIYSLCETLMEDLNNYCECMIPIDGINTLNIKLFPTLPTPAKVQAWYVPLFTVRIETLMDENWDLTMQRIIPYINGVNSVKRIADLADADIKLTKKCIRHLLYYNCVLLLDIFSFNAIYAPTAEFTTLITVDSEMQAECARYVNTAFESSRQEVAVSSSSAAATNATGDYNTSNNHSSSMRSSVLQTNHLGTSNPYLHSSSGGGASSSTAIATTSSSSNTTNTTTMLAAMVAAASSLEEDFWPTTGRGDSVVDGVSIVQLFANLQQGLTVREWYAQNSNMLANIDVRRFLTFGIIKGFLYRVHRYAIQTVSPSPSSSPKIKIKSRKRKNRHNINASASSSSDTSSSGEDEDDGTEYPSISKIQPFLDGTHCFDEICTELCISEKELMSRLAKPDLGEVVVICR